jgi:hypothetical protein
MIVFVCCAVKAVFMSKLRSRAATGRDAEAAFTAAARPVAGPVSS